MDTGRYGGPRMAKPMDMLEMEHGDPKAGLQVELHSARAR